MTTEVTRYFEVTSYVTTTGYQTGIRDLHFEPSGFPPNGFVFNTNTSWVSQLLMSGTQGNFGCNVFPFYGNLQSGDKVMIGMTSDKPVSLYVLTAVQFNAWNQTGKCAASGYSSDTVGIARDFTSYRLSWVVPSTGTYYLVFLNYNVASVTVTLDFRTSGYETSSTQSMIVYGTETLTSLRALSSLETIESPFLQANASWLIATAIVAILAIGFVALRIASKKMKSS